MRPLAVYAGISGADLEPGCAMLREAGFDVRVIAARDAEGIAREAADADALLIGYAAIDASLLDRLPRLKVISLISMGFDNVDLGAANRRNIWVANVVGGATEEVATHALALMLHLAREISWSTSAAGDGRWNERPVHLPMRLSTRTLGVIGLGRIGLKTAELAAPFFGRILGYDPLLPQDAARSDELARSGVQRVTLEEVQTSADVLTLHLPLTAASRMLVDAEFLRAMRPGASIVNVSRGGLVDSEAVRAAIDDGRLAGAALDVLDEEPPHPSHPLLNHPRVVVTPHIGYLSAESASGYVVQQARNVVTWYESGRPEFTVSSGF